MDMTVAATAFFDQYRDAYNRQDASAIASHLLPELTGWQRIPGLD